MEKPILFTAASRAEDLAAVRRELLKRYAADYVVECEAPADAALRRLAELSERKRNVIALLVVEPMEQTTGVEFLERAHDLTRTPVAFFSFRGETARRCGRCSGPRRWA